MWGVSWFSLFGPAAVRAYISFFILFARPWSLANKSPCPLIRATISVFTWFDQKHCLLTRAVFVTATEKIPVNCKTKIQSPTIKPLQLLPKKNAKKDAKNLSFQPSNLCNCCNYCNVQFGNCCNWCFVYSSCCCYCWWQLAWICWHLACWLYVYRYFLLIELLSI